MKKNSQITRIVLYQNIGFLAIIVICYLDELLKLPSFIFSDHPFAFMFQRPALDILLVFAVWFLVSMSTRRILERVQYLEKFMRLCAWCRQINFKGDWMPLEEFMKQGFDTPTTHGICPKCLEQQQEAVAKMKARRKAAAATAAAQAKEQTGH